MCIRYNMDLVFINAYTKFYQSQPFVLKILRKNTFLHQSRTITLLLINKFSPFAIPNHSFLISMSMQSLKKIGQNLLKLESGNEALTDGRTVTQNFKIFEGYNTFVWRSIKTSSPKGNDRSPESNVPRSNLISKNSNSSKL